jgi:hypothetical protein
MNHAINRRLMARPIPVAAALGAFALVMAVAPSASASAIAVPSAHGMTVTPTQPFDTTTDTFATQPEWLGAYEVNGEKSWATSFALGAPDSSINASEETIATKWQGHLTATQEARLSTLLVLHDNPANDVEAAAVELLILDEMSSPTAAGHMAGQDTDPSRKVDSIAFDKTYALSKIDPAVQTEAATLDTEAVTFTGTWTLNLAMPAHSQVGAASDWSVQVLGPDGMTGVPNRPIQLTATQGRFANGMTTITVTTPSDGSAILVPLTPTGSAPSISAASESPASAPRFLEPFNGDTPDTSRSPYFQENDLDLTASMTATASGGTGGGTSTGTGTTSLAFTGATVPVGVPITAGAVIALGVGMVIVASRRRRRLRH